MFVRLAFSNLLANHLDLLEHALGIEENGRKEPCTTQATTTGLALSFSIQELKRAYGVGGDETLGNRG